MPAENLIIRGAPRYIRGAAAGARGVITLIPEARVGAGRALRPVAMIELHPEGVRRHSIAAPRAGLLPLGLAGLLVAGAALLLDRLWSRAIRGPRT